METITNNDTVSKVKYSDSKLISIIRWFAWIAASIISALINVWFVSQLASHLYEMVIFAIVALVLECGKLSAILRANIFSALHKKVGDAGIRRKMKSSYTVYAIYAAFAIICATGFSVNMTTNVASNYDTQISTLESQKISIQELQIAIPISDELLKAKSSYEDLQQQYLIINREDDDLQFDYRSAVTNSEGTRKITWAQSDASRRRLASIKADRDEAQVLLDRLQLQYDESEARRKSQLAEAEQKFGTQIDIDTQIGALKINQAMNAGSAQIFITLGGVFGFDPNVFRLVILIFLSFLVEYIVFSLAPTSKVNRKLLYDYREFIPKEKVIEILEEFDKEIELYLGKGNIIIEPVIVELEKEITTPPVIEKIEVEKPKRIRKPRIKKVEDAPLIVPNMPESMFSSPVLKEEPAPIVEVEKVEEKKSPFIKPKESEETPKQTIEELKNEEHSITNTEEPMIHYRFGKTTESIMKKLIEFISLCIKEEGPFNMHPDFAATQLKLSSRAKQVFINQLSGIRLGTKPLITKNKYGEYYANYDSQQIINYVSEIKND